MVVSWNGRHLLPECLDSLLAQTAYPADLEIVVVDNGSEDGTPEYLAAGFPQVQVVRSDSNVGFAGGADLGIAGFRGEFLALLNNDATLAPDALQRMLETITRPGNERVGAVTARIMLAGAFLARRAVPGEAISAGSYRSGNLVLEPAALSSPASFRLVNSTGNIVTRGGRGQDRDWLRPEGEESRDTDVFGFCGGAALLRRAALDEVGTFDASLFLYYEDTDLSWRLRLAGWHIVYAPDAVVHHLHAASSDSQSEMFAFHNERNRLLTLLRDAPLGFAASKIARFALTTASLAGKRLIGRAVPDDQVFRSVLRLRVLAAVLSWLPVTLRKRRRVPTRRRRSAVFHEWAGVTERPLNEAG